MSKYAIFLRKKLKWQHLLLCLIFLCLFGFGIYKNGIVSFSYGKGNFIYLLQLILIPIIFVGAGYCFDTYILKKESLNQKKSCYYMALLSLMIPSGISILMTFCYLGICLGLLFLNEKKSSNIILFGYLIILLGVRFLGIQNCNNYECVLEMHLSIMNRFIGFDVSGLYMSSCLLLLLMGVVLSYFYWYKKNITFYSYLVFMCCVILESIFFQGNIFLSLFQPLALITCLVVLPYTKKTPYLISAQKLFGFISGIILYLTIHFNVLELGYLFFFILQVFHSYFDSVIMKLKNVRKEA